MTDISKNAKSKQSCITAVMVSADIKKECELMYSQIKNAENRLKELREICKHEDTFIGNYSYRIGVIDEVKLCEYCGSVLSKI